MADELYKKKLIEVALPLEAINREAAREKTIRHGHPSTLHLWWARRPLAACRAVLFAQLVDDPSARPDEFPTEDLQERERERLFEIIERLVKWENSNNETVLEEARAEIRKCFDGEPPPVLDPFAGGGSIPLEAQRLGLTAYASDLNPVAVLINKALIEIPSRWSGRPPVHGRDEGRLDTDVWRGVQGLAEDVRFYGKWIRAEAERRIGHLYPMAVLPDGSKAPVIAWIWARTVACPNPACGAAAPLVRSFWLGKRKGKEAWIRPVVNGRKVDFEIGHGKAGPPVAGTVERSGATCLVCGQPIDLRHVRSEGQAGRLGAQLMAVVAEGDRKREYVAPSEDQASVAAAVSAPENVPDTELPERALGFRVQAYGMRRHADLFSPRQLVALCTLTDLVGEVRAMVEGDALGCGYGSDESKSYANDIAQLLAFFVSKQAELGSSLCRWKIDAECPVGVFGRQAVSMVWDYAEGNPLGSSAGSWEVIVRNQERTLLSPSYDFHRARNGTVRQASALSLDETWPRDVVTTTDPPYYDNIGYADLSDFFYVWLRASLRDQEPSLLSTVLTPKADELIANPYRDGFDQVKARRHFESGFVATFKEIARLQDLRTPTCLFYAFKQEEGDDEGGSASTGWETMLAGLIDAGLTVQATWPIRTEAVGRMRNFASNALASSIVLACRPRSSNAGITDRRGFLDSLRSELPTALREMQQGAIAPVDLAQSSIGPGMAVFSRYVKVVEPTGEQMRVRAALGLINQVLDEVLAEQEGDFDAETRWAIKWFSQYGFDEGPFGDAETLCKATGTAINGMQRSGIVATKAPKVWLVSREDLPGDWDPATDDRVPVWEATQQLVKALAEGGDASAAALLARLGGLGETARELAYRLYSICERKGWAKEAGAYNALAVSWLDIQRLASADAPAANEQGSLL